jgi:hypothetical protein
VVQHVDAAELRVVVAAVLAAAADVVLVAHHLPKLCVYLATALNGLHVCNLAQRSGLGTGSTREKRGAGEAEKRKKFRVEV